MEDFRDEVVSVGRIRLPEMDIRPGRTSAEVRSHDHFLYLGHVYKLIGGLDAPARSEMIVQWLSHFSPAADAKNERIKTETDDWSKARPLLRPKLMARMLPVVADRLVSQPFVAELTTIYAIDLGDSDLYVSKDKASRWNVPLDVIHARAVANLEAMSSGLGQEARDDKGALLNIRLSDGYDAARLILPGLRGRLLKMLGEPFHAAVPARDLFICWSTGDDRFESDMAGQARDEAASMDHPVSERVFVVDANGVRPA